VFLVDDHPMTREGLAAIINRQPDLEVSGDAGDAAAAMAALPHAKPDLIVTDLTLPNGSGMEFIKNVHAILPAMPVLVLSMHDELLYAERALHAGARGYLMKDADTEKVLAAIRLVLDGQVYVSPQMNRRLLDGMAGPAPGASPIASLSPREFEVFQMIGRGLSTKEVAARLGLSHKTVEVHRANIRTKLQLDDAISLMYHATRWVESQKSTPPA
jgi:DNA-binding NarL/FixJ family response regulator